jgi:hypothetical protein
MRSHNRVAERDLHEGMFGLSLDLDETAIEPADLERTKARPILLAAVEVERFAYFLKPMRPISDLVDAGLGANCL